MILTVAFWPYRAVSMDLKSWSCCNSIADTELWDWSVRKRLAQCADRKVH